MVSGSKKVLITGISGRIGQLICQHLGARYEITGIDREPFDAVPTEVADIADFDAIASAFEGVDIVVHLAANPSPRASWASTLDNNIIGTRNVFEAARQAGVQLHAQSCIQSRVGLRVGLQRGYPLASRPGQAEPAS